MHARAHTHTQRQRLSRKSLSLSLSLSRVQSFSLLTFASFAAALNFKTAVDSLFSYGCKTRLSTQRS